MKLKNEKKEIKKCKICKKMLKYPNNKYELCSLCQNMRIAEALKKGVIKFTEWNIGYVKNVVGGIESHSYAQNENK